MKEGGFELRKWNSSNKELMGKICVEENKNSYEQGKNCLGLRKVLGINWDIEKDLFEFDFDEIVQLAKDLKFTKRNLLKINATLFDPLGLISPITLQGKLLFKLLCIYKSDWDDELDDIIKQKCKKREKTCKKVQGKVLRPPSTSALPEYRVCAEFPFQITGFDFATYILKVLMLINVLL